MWGAQGWYSSCDAVSIRHLSLLALFPCILSGCGEYTTAYLEQERVLREKRERKEISNAEYEAALRRHHDEEPWGAVGEKKPQSEHLAL